MRALVLGDSGGIGAAIAAELRDRGAEVVGCSRRDGLDLTDEGTVSATASVLAGQSFELIFNATGAL
uniref:NAD-dependent epimerase/dehydratase family protein n=1 Tax=uncultured Paracoccus sp. TaxID=189685 RepID=UPI00351A216A